MWNTAAGPQYVFCISTVCRKNDSVLCAKDNQVRFFNISTVLKFKFVVLWQPFEKLHPVEEIHGIGPKVTEAVVWRVTKDQTLSTFTVHFCAMDQSLHKLAVTLKSYKHGQAKPPIIPPSLQTGVSKGVQCSGKDFILSILRPLAVWDNTGVMLPLEASMYVCVWLTGRTANMLSLFVVCLHKHLNLYLYREGQPLQTSTFPATPCFFLTTSSSKPMLQMSKSFTTIADQEAFKRLPKAQGNLNLEEMKWWMNSDKLVFTESKNRAVFKKAERGWTRTLNTVYTETYNKSTWWGYRWFDCDDEASYEPWKHK